MGEVEVYAHKIDKALGADFDSNGMFWNHMRVTINRELSADDTKNSEFNGFLIFFIFICAYPFDLCHPCAINLTLKCKHYNEPYGGRVE